MNLVNQDSIALHCIVEKLKLMHIHSQWRAPTLQGTIENGKPYQNKHGVGGGRGRLYSNTLPLLWPLRIFLKGPREMV